MNLKEYIAGLNKFLKEHPEMGDKSVITSKDDEGNGYSEVYYTPTAGMFTDDEFIGTGEFDWYEEEYEEPAKVNAVCVN